MFYEANERERKWRGIKNRSLFPIQVEQLKKEQELISVLKRRLFLSPWHYKLNRLIYGKSMRWHTARSHRNWIELKSRYNHSLYLLLYFKYNWETFIDVLEARVRNWVNSRRSHSCEGINPNIFNTSSSNNRKVLIMDIVHEPLTNGESKRQSKQISTNFILSVACVQ